MASALWLGFSEPGRLAPFLALPVQVMVLPRLPQKAPLSGQRFFTPAAGAPMMAALAGRDLYYIGVDDFSPIPIPPAHGRLLALGEVPPPAGSPIGFAQAPPREQYAALCRILPPAEPSTFYIAGSEVRCSVVEEDYLPLIERLGRL